MTKYTYKLIVFTFLVLVSSFFVTSEALAITPSVTMVNDANGYTQINVYGDPNSPVILKHGINNNSMNSVVTMGYTNHMGYFTGNVNLYNYNLTNGSQVAVWVNGQQSNTIYWQNNNWSNNNSQHYNDSITLSVTRLNLTVGQVQTITILSGYNNNYYGNNNNMYYVSNNSNGIVNATVNGNVLTLYGQNQGTTNATVCSNSNNYYSNYNSQSKCANVQVNVSGYNYNNPIHTYPSHPLTVYSRLVVGSMTTITLNSNNYQYPNNYSNYYNSNNYVIKSHNSVVARAHIRGNELTIYGLKPGVSNINVCSVYGNECIVVSVTVINKNQYNYNYPYNYGDNNYYSYDNYNYNYNY